MLKTPRKTYSALFISLLLLIVLGGLNLALGSTKIPVADLWRFITGQMRDPDEPAYVILRYARLPRMLAAILTGAGLSLAGLILQSLFRNPLASANLIGVNSGAGFTTALIIAFFPQHYELLPLASFLGALCVTLLVYGLAKKHSRGRQTIILAGVALSSLMGALTDAILLLFPDTLIDRRDFILGSLTGLRLQDLLMPGILIAIAAGFAIYFSTELNLLYLGDELAGSLGLAVGPMEFFFIILASLLAGSVVSFAGLVGFIGLIVPHILRLIVGQDHRILIPLAAIFGAAFALFCDLLSRILFAPYELPLGIVLSFLGAPFFLYLLLHRKGAIYDV